MLDTLQTVYLDPFSEDEPEGYGIVIKIIKQDDVFIHVLIKFSPKDKPLYRRILKK